MEELGESSRISVKRDQPPKKTSAYVKDSFGFWFDSDFDWLRTKRTKTKRK